MTTCSAKLIKNTVRVLPLLGLWCMVSMFPSWTGVLLLTLAFWTFGRTFSDGNGQ